MLVAGSYLFGSDDMAGSFDALEVRLTSTLALPLALPLALALPLPLPRPTPNQEALLTHGE